MPPGVKESKNLAKETLGILKKRVDCWWFATLYEMINTRYIYDIPIHTTVTSLFLDNPILAKLMYQDKLVENPIVLYNGYTYNRCLYVAIFPPNASHTNHSFFLNEDFRVVVDDTDIKSIPISLKN